MNQVRCVYGIGCKEHKTVSFKVSSQNIQPKKLRHQHYTLTV